jgi:hypothetical protein
MCNAQFPKTSLLQFIFPGFTSERRQTSAGSPESGTPNYRTTPLAGSWSGGSGTVSCYTLIATPNQLERSHLCLLGLRGEFWCASSPFTDWTPSYHARKPRNTQSSDTEVDDDSDERYPHGGTRPCCPARLLHVAVSFFFVPFLDVRSLHDVRSETRAIKYRHFTRRAGKASSFCPLFYRSAP